MKIAVNTISTKKGAGGAYQIAYNFLMETLRNQECVEWYYITSEDVDELISNEFDKLKGTHYFVFPTQPDFKGTYNQVKKELKIWEENYKPDVIYTISSPCYFKFSTPEVMRFANAWVTNPNKDAWASMTFKEKLRMWLYCINQKRMLRGAKYIITQSETVKKGLLRITGLPEYYIGVVPNVLPKVFANAEVKKVIDPDWIDVACVAAPVPHKNLDIIPDVLTTLRDEHGINNVRFHLTIPEDHLLWKTIHSKCDENGMGENVVNHGRCTQQQLVDVYNHCRVCFLPTLLETFSASSLEAMRFGLYIVATDYDFNREIIRDAGLYYCPKNASDASTKIMNLITNQELQSKLKKKMNFQLDCYRDYGEHFNNIVNFLYKVSKNRID